MYLARLRLSNFRNYERLDFTPGAGVTLIHGQNAQGKSNLLEAIYLLATTRPARGSEADLIRWQAAAEGFGVARVVGEAERKQGPVAVEIAVAPRQENGSVPERRGAGHASKRLKLNGVPRRASDVIGQIAAVLFTAADIDLITGPPALRRRYLDITISQTDPLYVRALQRYQRVLLQRNSLLRRIGEGQARSDELAYWDEQLVREGAQIVRTRRQTMAALEIAAREAHAALSGGRERLTIAYAPQTPLPDGPSPPLGEIEAGLRGGLHRQQRREIALGQTLIGPHRDDLQFSLDGVLVSAFGSRAQQRTAALALRLAETVFLTSAGRDPPLLLLDDIFSELDETRRSAVLDALGGAEQVFVTTAEPERFGAKFRRGAAVYEVCAGVLRREEQSA
ncbi:MAG TPA: DNA replication/repair protein RecF [Dehalococcoidia bacterium]|nr:DNA replication/repair protein RecF [Dehalococcoidia bacterium]